MLTHAIPLPYGSKELLQQDPWQFLKPTEKMRIEQENIPFNAKKMWWVPDKKEGYRVGELVEKKGDMVAIKVQGEVRSTCFT